MKRGGPPGQITLRRNPWATPSFPLVERQRTAPCVSSGCARFPSAHEVPRSACVSVPIVSNEEWRWLRDNDSIGFQRAVEIDTTADARAHRESESRPTALRASHLLALGRGTH